MHDARRQRGEELIGLIGLACFGIGIIAGILIGVTLGYLLWH